jgi:hypothetical protein
MRVNLTQIPKLCSFIHKLPASARVAGAAYTVLGLFAIALSVVRWAWSTVSVNDSIVLAALVAAPTVLGLVWSRLSGFKVYGVEVSLIQASTQLEAGLVDAVMVQYYSDNRGLLELISKTLVGREEPVEIPLRRGEKPFWWSTRLFLVAALTMDYTRVQAFVFVEGQENRSFVGLARPSDVRANFGHQVPSFEDVYGELRARLDPGMPATQEVEHLIEWWSEHAFSQDGRQMTESEVRVKVDRVTLLEWMGQAGGLDDRCVRWKGLQDRALLADIVGFDGPYVPLVEHGRLHKVACRRAVVEEVAAKALK